mgnify:FL=1
MTEQSKHEKRQAKIENLLNMAQEGIKDVFESEKYKNYLKVMSKFHHYSFRNNLSSIIHLKCWYTYYLTYLKSIWIYSWICSNYGFYT